MNKNNKEGIETFKKFLIKHEEVTNRVIGYWSTQITEEDTKREARTNIDKLLVALLCKEWSKLDSNFLFKPVHGLGYDIVLLHDSMSINIEVKSKEDLFQRAWLNDDNKITSPYDIILKNGLTSLEKEEFSFDVLLSLSRAPRSDERLWYARHAFITLDEIFSSYKHKLKIVENRGKIVIKLYNDDYEWISPNRKIKFNNEAQEKEDILKNHPESNYTPEKIWDDDNDWNELATEHRVMKRVHGIIASSAADSNSRIVCVNEKDVSEFLEF